MNPSKLDDDYAPCILNSTLHVCLIQADRFQRTAKTLKRMFWWQNCKVKLIVAGAVILVALVIFLLVCFSGTNCFSKN
jgi:vesicle-associated membrane protein 72